MKALSLAVNTIIVILIGVMIFSIIIFILNANTAEGTEKINLEGDISNLCTSYCSQKNENPTDEFTFDKKDELNEKCNQANRGKNTCCTACKFDEYNNNTQQD